MMCTFMLVVVFLSQPSPKEREPIWKSVSFYYSFRFCLKYLNPICFKLSSSFL
jgi:hypothetical protein